MALDRIIETDSDSRQEYCKDAIGYSCCDNVIMIDEYKGIEPDNDILEGD